MSSGPAFFGNVAENNILKLQDEPKRSKAKELKVSENICLDVMSGRFKVRNGSFVRTHALT